MQGVWIHSLVRKLRAHMLHDVVKTYQANICISTQKFALLSYEHLFMSKNALLS